jgi:asparagine synthase (glutamine-hydrolysing)
MCGISGEVNFSGGMHEATETIRAMNDVMAERGPDGEGIWTSERAALGHRRLAIIDPEGGRQPMTCETALGSVAVSHSGEVYNYQELRRDLKARGHDFRTQSDTEVVLKSYMEFGEGVAEKLRGMFAIAVWDERAHADKLTLIRDQLGVKPLCYYPTSDGVVFGSEPKTILAHPRIKRSVGLAEWREHFSGLMAALKSPGRLLWKGMKEVKPGQVVTVNRQGIREHTYWRLQTQPHTGDYGSTVETVRDMLTEIIESQMVADVPVGTLLSGGIDSSIITALASRHQSTVNSYIVDFAERKKHGQNNPAQTGLDTPFAEEVAAMFGTNHTRFAIDAVQLASRELRERVVWARGLPPPLLRDTLASQLSLFEGVHNSKVVFSGEMADEAFGGYAIFHDPKVLQGSGWPTYSRRLHNYVEESRMLEPEFCRALKLNTYVEDTFADSVRSVERLKGESDLDYRLRVITYLEITQHIGFLLDSVDRLAGSVGLEVRVPFCDHRLVQYAYNVPWEYRAPQGREKGLLRDAFSSMLPPSIVRRPKYSYPRTSSPVYSQELQRQVQELLSEKSRPVFTIFNHEWLRQVAIKPIEHLTYVEEGEMVHALETDIWFDTHRPDINM